MYNIPTVKILQLSLRNINCKYVRLLSSGNKQKESSNKGYVPIYMFPYIKSVCIVNRLKWYQTLLTATTIPGSAILNEMKYITLEEVGVVTLLGLSMCAFFYSTGYVAKKFIGYIYYDEETDMVKISYADYWGRRKNMEFPRNDIIPISDLPERITDRLYISFKRFSTEDQLKLCLKPAIIKDQEKFDKIIL